MGPQNLKFALSEIQKAQESGAETLRAGISPNLANSICLWILSEKPPNGVSSEEIYAKVHQKSLKTEWKKIIISGSKKVSWRKYNLCSWTAHCHVFSWSYIFNKRHWLVVRWWIHRPVAVPVPWHPLCLTASEKPGTGEKLSYQSTSLDFVLLNMLLGTQQAKGELDSGENSMRLLFTNM